MSKKKHKVKFIVIAVIAALGLFLTFFGFTLPTTTTRFNGFFNALPVGFDLGGGTCAVYEVSQGELTDTDFSNKFEKTYNNLCNVLNGKGYNIVKQGDNLVRVEASTSDAISSYFDIIGNQTKLQFADASNPETAEIIIYGENVKKSFAANANSAWGVVIEFDEEGKTLLEELTTKISGSNLYIIFSESDDENIAIQVDTVITDGYLQLSLSTGGQANAESFATQINLLRSPLLLKEIYNDTVSSTFGQNIINLLIIAFATIVVAIFAYTILRYGILGVLSSFASVFFFVLYVFLLQSIPYANLTLSGVIGAVFVFVLSNITSLLIIEKAKSEYSIGKKIPNSVMSGFKKLILPTVDIYAFLALISIIVFFIGNTFLNAFAFSLFVGLFVSIFSNFIIFRGFAKIYLNINPTKPNPYNFKRGANINELH